MALRVASRLCRVKLDPCHRCALFPPGRDYDAGDGIRGEHPKRRGEPNIKPQVHLTQARFFHLTRHNESSVIVAGVAVAASAMALQYGLKAYNKYQVRPIWRRAIYWMEQEKQPNNEDPKKTDNEAKDASSSSVFGAFGKRYYEGGFEDKMSRKEAALILGVRESATPQRIKDAHRRILMINHPDKGGSKYMAAKINEAKELLLKGRERE
ncbi:unnamed protein product [Choristocarpus tenellus]